jgi:hypothetical protein
MLNVQQFLLDNGPLALQENYGIKMTESSDDRVILNYHQIDSDHVKYEEIVRECRGLVLNKQDWSLVARSFKRFYNLGESKEQNKFQWEHCFANEKVDGSLILLYHWDGKWRVNTKGGFGDNQVMDSPFTFSNLVDLALGQNWFNKLDPELTYVGEICSPYNKVVRHYSTPCFYLLTTFNGEMEHTPVCTEDIAKTLGLNIPETFSFNDVADVQGFLTERAANDPTYEGVVLRDQNNRRIKCKSDSYVYLHRLHNNGNITSVKSILHFVLKGEEAEILNYFPELEPHVKVVKDAIRPVVDRMMWLWNVYKSEQDQKTFALAIKDHSLASVLFEARKRRMSPLDVLPECEDLVYNKLFKNS